MIALAPRHFVLLILMNVIWGLNLIVSKIGLEYFPPVLFTLARFAVVALLLFPRLRILPGQMSALVVAALLSGGAHFALMFVGIAQADNLSAVAIAGQLSVPFTTLLSVALLGEVVRWRRWVGIVLSFAGVAIMGFDPDVAGWSSLGLIIASAFVGSLGLIAVKKLEGIKPLELQAWLAWTSLPVLFLLALAFERDAVPDLASIPAAGWGTVAYSAILVTLFAQTGFYRLVQRYPVTSVAPLTVLSPLFSIAFAVTLLDDRLTPSIIVGAVATLLGVIIITLRERRIADTGT